MRLGVVGIALDQAQVVVIVRRQVPVRVHRDKAGMLQEARVDASSVAGVVGRHGVDHVVLEPLVGLVGRQRVDRGRAFARVDRAAHHGHGARRLLARRRHQRNRGQHRHRGLAHRDHMQVLGADMADEFLDVVDVVRQVEGAFLDRHHARVDPVGDVDLVVLQQRAHGVAQQRGVVARQRRGHQYHRLVLEQLDGLGVVGIALEAQQLAEGLFQHGLLDDGDVAPVGAHRLDIERRFFVFLAEPVQQFVAGGQAGCARYQRHRAERVGEGLGGRLGPRGQRVQDRALELMQLIEHAVSAWSY